MMAVAEARKVCVIGAGSSGLAAARNFDAEGFEVDIYERESDLGGVWNYCSPAGRVYASTSMISSKPFTQYSDFPMPDHFPEYPLHGQVLSYLREYARDFKLLQLVRFGLTVEAVSSLGDGTWNVRLSSGASFRYGAVVVANGHNSVPSLPSCPGHFSGTSIHSAHYRTPDAFEGKRVLVVGRGNSGCDIAVEAAATARAVFSSARRGYHFIPKYFGGVPSDQLGDAFLRRNTPLQKRRAATLAAIELEIGRLDECGLPLPDHALFESHPIVNGTFPLAVKAGRIRPKPDIARLEGETVHFVDGSSESIDMIVFATGYRLELPFLSRDDQPVSSRWEPLMNVFHPRHETLFFAGFIQPDSGQFGLVHWQMRVAALYAARLRDRRAQASEMILKCAAKSPIDGGIDYVASSRHLLEVEHWSYLALLKNVVESLEQ